MRQLWLECKRARDPRVFPWLCAVCLALGGCDTPTWVVLRAKCADGGGSDPACAVDAGPGSALATVCLKDLECTVGELCVRGSCAPCDLGKPACPSCNTGSVIATSSINGCPVCTCAPQLCKRHADCPAQSLCEGSLCVPCDASSSARCPDTCPWGFSAQTFKRNQCASCECAPANACLSDADCAPGLQCYRGQQCQDTCSELSCCFGNFCELPGCKDADPALGCDLVGCADGQCAGDPSCKPATCKCNGASFECVNACTAVCKPP
jgi:hypothetical protein